MIFVAANFAALHLQELTGPDAAQALGIGQETVRSHLKKAQVKLDVRSRAHAACPAASSDRANARIRGNVEEIEITWERNPGEHRANAGVSGSRRSSFRCHPDCP